MQFCHYDASGDPTSNHTNDDVFSKLFKSLSIVFQDDGAKEQNAHAL